MKKVISSGAVLIPETARKIFEGQIFDVYQWQQKMFDGSEETFEMLKRPDTVLVIPVIEDKIIVLEDEQPHTGMSLSFPGGRVDKQDSNILSAAKREVLEETGYEFSNWRLIKVFQPHSKIEWFIYYYLAWEAGKKTVANLDAGEKIKLLKMSFEGVKDNVMMKNGYLAGAHEIFENILSLQQLLGVPEARGQQVEDNKQK